MTDKKDKIVKEFITRLAEADKSSETDSRYMQSLLRKLGFVQARVVGGIVYLEGRGTITAPPTSIHTIAQNIKEAKRW